MEFATEPQFALQPSLLAPVRCPNCLGPLEPTKSGPILFGKLRCQCHHYPVISGVLVLDRGARIEQLLAAVDADEMNYVEAIAATEYHIPRAVLRGEPTSFVKAVECYVEGSPSHAIRNFEWMVHAKYWHATPKYLAALRLAPYVAETACLPVVDIGCGFGHLARLYGSVLGSGPFYLVDRDPIHLLLAAWVLGPDLVSRTCLIAMHLRESLPFARHSAGLILNSDSFNEFNHQAGLLRRCAETLAPGGKLLFTHLHNRGRSDEPFQGNSHSRSVWKGLFEDAFRGSVCVASDEALRVSLLQDRELDAPGEAIDNPRSFSALFPAVANIPRFEASRFGKRALATNPIYAVSGEGNLTHLARRRLTPLFEAEHEPHRYFPDLTCDNSDFSNEDSRHALFRRGVLV